MNLILLWFAFVQLLHMCNGWRQNELPNYIIMLMDDMGWGDLGLNGEPHRETPNIDKMAAEGLVATSMYASAPLCSPSRASLLTGRLPIRNGFYSDNAEGRNAYTPQEIVGGISHSEVLLPELLHQKNYTNVLVGKWHLGHREEFLPLNHGFDKYFGSTNCHFGPYDDIDTPNIPVFRNSKMVGRYFEQFQIDRANGESNMTKLLTDEAVDFILSRQDQENPFFLLWTPDSSHAPTYASPDYLGSSRRGQYGDAVKELDASVGAIINAVEAAGLSENTLIIFSSDNGAALVSQYDGGSNGPFLCGKQTTFEGGMREPGIFYWPGTIPAGATTEQVWTQMDFFTTFSSLSGIALPYNTTYDGLDLKSNLLQPILEQERPVFYYRGNRLMAVRNGSYKIHLWTWNTNPEELDRGIDYCPGQRLENITTSEPFDHQGVPIMFNIDYDPGEKYPIASWKEEYKNNIEELREIIREHEMNLSPGQPQLNYCDRHVMHWAPPGCEELNDCLTKPESNPYLCDWPH